MVDYRLLSIFSLWLLSFLAMPLQAGPKIESWFTTGGARVMFVHAPELPMLDIELVFDAGSARDKNSQGLALLTNALLPDGAGDWSADQIAERLESVGAEIDIGSGRDMAWVSVRTLTESQALETAVETLATVVSAPRFRLADFERNREAMLVSLSQGEQSPGTVAGKAFFKALYGEHAYAGYRGGSRESLAALSTSDVQAFYQRYYVARNALVAIVGAVDRRQAEQLAERVTAGLTAGEHAPQPPKVSSLEKAKEVIKPFPSSQSHILMGQPGVYRGDPDYFTLYVGNHILGGSGLVSLLSEEVREKRGLSYSIYSYFSPMRRSGPFIVGAQTQNARADEALAVIRKTLQHYIDEGPSETELTAAKQNITGGFPLRIASNSKIIGYLAMLGFYDQPLDYLNTFVDKINAVTREQIREAFARRIDPTRFVTVVVGNGKKAQSGQ
ncbi:MAG: pitrilysin family protein [Candidatus Sedimenticola sp. (ex Thyasira tokunagai)]